MNIHQAVEAEDLVTKLADELDAGADMTNAHRGARVLRALIQVYQDDAESAVRDGLSDLRHACDLLGLAYHDQDRQARGNYATEIHQEGPAQGPEGNGHDLPTCRACGAPGTDDHEECGCCS